MTRRRKLTVTLPAQWAEQLEALERAHPARSRAELLRMLLRAGLERAEGDPAARDAKKLQV